jgi:hypothetical protein
MILLPYLVTLPKISLLYYMIESNKNSPLMREIDEILDIHYKNVPK